MSEGAPAPSAKALGKRPVVYQDQTPLADTSASSTSSPNVGGDAELARLLQAEFDAEVDAEVDEETAKLEAETAILAGLLRDLDEGRAVPEAGNDAFDMRDEEQYEHELFGTSPLEPAQRSTTPTPPLARPDKRRRVRRISISDDEDAAVTPPLRDRDPGAGVLPVDAAAESAAPSPAARTSPASKCRSPRRSPTAAEPG